MPASDQLKKYRSVLQKQDEMRQANALKVNQAEDDDPLSKLRSFLQNPVYETPGSGMLGGNSLSALHEFYMQHIFPKLPQNLQKGPFDIANNYDASVLGPSHRQHGKNPRGSIGY